jgi:hypothetical protein
MSEMSKEEQDKVEMEKAGSLLSSGNSLDTVCVFCNILKSIERGL